MEKKTVAKATAAKTTYHHGDLRQALLKAALVILKDQDVRGLSLREVARQAGVSHTAPYRHFADKAALLEAVAEEGFIEFGRYLNNAVAQTPAEPIESLKAIGEAYVRYALEHPTHFRLMFSYLPNCPDAGSSLPTTAQGTFQILVDVIVSAQAAGVIKAGDPNELAIGRWALVHGLSMLLLDGMLPNPQLTCSPADQTETEPNGEAIAMPSKRIACEDLATDLIRKTIANSLQGLILEG